jgi:hypothetical protein
MKSQQQSKKTEIAQPKNLRDVAINLSEKPNYNKN